MVTGQSVGLLIISLFYTDFSNPFCSHLQLIYKIRSGVQQRSRHPCAVHAGRYGQQAGGIHPTGMHSSFSLIRPPNPSDFLLIYGLF